MTRPPHPYAEMADILGIDWCDEAAPACLARHVDGGSITEGTIHLIESETGVAATVRFLTLAARVLDPSLDEETVMWRRAHRLVLAKRDLAHRVHVRLPRRVFDFERTYVLAGVAGLTNEVPGRKRAYDWARR